MEPYANRGGDSGVIAYECNDDSIVVEFEGGASYLYDCTAPGRTHVEEMERLARDGEGLNAYINTHVRKQYAAKLS